MRYTHIGKLKLDPRVIEAKRLLLDAIAENKKDITAIPPPDPDLKNSYEDALKQFAKCRGMNLWYPYIGDGIGRGVFVELMDGSVKYDFISGIGVHHFGHSHPDILAASLDGAISDLVMQGNLQQNS